PTLLNVPRAPIGFGPLELRKPNWQDLLYRHSSVAVFLGQDELLSIGEACRNHHFAAGLQLIDQWGGNEVRRCRHDHLVERRVFRPAMIAVANPELDVEVAQTAESLPRLHRELLYDFNAVYLSRQRR